MPNNTSSHSLDFLFHPRSLAIAGVSGDMNRLGGGRGFLESLLDIGFPGKIYPINLEGGEVLGFPVYPGIKAIPEPVDYVISAIPAQFNPQLVRDCADKGVPAIHIFSAGFGEIADVSGKKLEMELVDIARRTGIRIIGPNCMGLYCPRGGLAFFRELPRTSGGIGFISQSGGNSAHAIRETALKGVYFSKAISYGNACDLNESDFLDYLVGDPETEVITGYIEGAKDGKRFASALKVAAARKPVILYKAGVTEDGTRAVASHTGTLAGSNAAWDALLRQTGVIAVHSMEELVDVAVLCKLMAPPRGTKLALMGIGGGAIVQSADECVSAGLKLPPLPDTVKQRLSQIYGSETGASFRNPIDMYWRKRELIREAIKVVADCDQIDLLMIQVLVGVGGSREKMLLEPYLESIISLGHEINRRSVVVLRLMGPAKFWPFVPEAQSALADAGFPVYLSARDAANAVVKYARYHQRRKQSTSSW